MKVLQTLPSSAARTIRMQPAKRPDLYGGNIVRALQDRYGFLEVPTKLSDFDYQGGVKFLQGLFESGIFDLEVYDDGVKVYSAGGTAVCDSIIDDLVEAANDAGVEFEQIPQNRLYGSALEIELGVNFSALFSKMQGVGALIGSKLAGYGGPDEPYQGAGITMIGRLAGAAPDPFRLERRVGSEFESNVFFSTAPLSIADHVAVLTEMERAIS